METIDFVVVNEKTGNVVFFGTKDECKKYETKQYRMQGDFPEMYPEVDYNILKWHQVLKSID